MLPAITLWLFALAALIHGALALAVWRRPSTRPRKALAASLAATALWALCVAGIDARDLAARLAECGRDLAWLALLVTIARQGRATGLGMGAAFGAVGLVCAIAIPLSIAAEVVTLPAARALLTDTLVLFRMMASAGALVLTRGVFATAGERVTGDRAGALAGLAGLWSLDLLVFSTAYAWPAATPVLIALRGGGMILVAIGAVTVAQRTAYRTVALSRAVAVRAIAAVAILVYAGVTAWAAASVGPVRIIQTAVVLGSATTLATLLATPWLRAWARVMIAKHLFRHRYDYRAEWLRFADTLGQPGGDAAPLAERVVKAVADLTDSSAALLLMGESGRWEPVARFGWAEACHHGGEEALARYLATSGRIVELDPVRAGAAPAEEAMAMPGWLLSIEDAWAVVPLFHLEALIGAIVLGRPPVDRALDWEDFDLLRVAGRQAASYLAEARSQRALADAAQFDEFHRRFAFILHDIKNLASQLALVARNAERHADNPAFRADMVATLTNSSTRMATLLARLSERDVTPSEDAEPVDVTGLLARVALARRAAHPVIAEAGQALWITARPARLEQVLGQLVQNAVEASGGGEPVVLSASAAAEWVRITVVDHGEGMSPAFVREQLFRPFSSTKSAGFGLGAYEARQLVASMGGTLSVVSREGEGTTFTIDLPSAAALEIAA